MIWLRIGSLFMFLAVALGAFGAHGLRNVLSAQAHAIYQTAVFYQAIHGLALLILGVFSLHHSSKALQKAGASFSAGILLFSGSLYLLALTGSRAWGMVTPAGGLAFLA